MWGHSSPIANAVGWRFSFALYMARLSTFGYSYVVYNNFINKERVYQLAYKQQFQKYYFNFKKIICKIFSLMTTILVRVSENLFVDIKTRYQDNLCWIDKKYKCLIFLFHYFTILTKWIKTYLYRTTICSDMLLIYFKDT